MNKKTIVWSTVLGSVLIVLMFVLLQLSNSRCPTPEILSDCLINTGWLFGVLSLGGSGFFYLKFILNFGFWILAAWLFLSSKTKQFFKPDRAKVLVAVFFLLLLYVFSRNCSAQLVGVPSEC